jgi:hypothetical protein
MLWHRVLGFVIVVASLGLLAYAAWLANQPSATGLPQDLIALNCFFFLLALWGLYVLWRGIFRDKWKS